MILVMSNGGKTRSERTRTGILLGETGIQNFLIS
jgi:hypothetical protein